VKPTRSAQNVIELDSVRFVTQKIVFIFLETNQDFSDDLLTMLYTVTRLQFALSVQQRVVTVLVGGIAVHASNIRNIAVKKQ